MPWPTRRSDWAGPRSQVEVIDADLGLSGRSAANRSGFKDLLGRVCLGEVGAIFGLEVSRLARSSADLSRLLELARLTDTLVIDADGIYDLADINDRLVLGVKNQMSEAELHFLASRLQGARQAAAERGELRMGLPVGYVYDDEGQMVTDPDAEVQAAITDVFAAFRAGGSAFQVVVAFKDRLFPKRAYGGVWAGQLRWGRLTHSRVVKLLENPLYAGAYVYGRAHSRRVVEPDGTVRTKVVHLPREKWPVAIHDHHDGVPELGRLPRQPGSPGGEPDPGRRPTPQGRTRPVPRDHLLRVLRSSHVDPLPRQRVRLLRMLIEDRPDEHADLPVHHRRHRRPCRRRTLARRAQPSRDGIGSRRRRRSRRPAQPPQPCR